MRYADDFVVLTRQRSEEVQAFIEEKLEGWLGLKINRGENADREPSRRSASSLDFLGYRFGLTGIGSGRKRRYWNLGISKAALLRGAGRSWADDDRTTPVLETAAGKLVAELNAHLRGLG